MKCLVAMMLLAGTFALSFSYDGEVFVTPGEERVVKIYLQSENESGVYPVTCSSSISVKCPNYVRINPGSETFVALELTAGIGRHLVNVSIGGRPIRFVVESSNHTDVFYNMLQRYNNSFFRLEARYGKSELLDLGKLLVSEGFSHYKKGEYPAVKGILENLETLLGEYYASIGTVEEQPARLELSFIPLLLVGGMLGAYTIATRKPKRNSGAGELSKLMEKEFGGGVVGKKED